MNTVLVTGASRGIGLEHVRQYAEQGWQVIACARRAAEDSALARLRARWPDRVDIRLLDLTQHAEVDALAHALAGRAIDVLINNAGSYGPKGVPEGMAYQTLDNMDYAIWRQILEVNLLATFKVATAFRPHLLNGAMRLLVMMSTDLGSIAQNTMGGSYAYRSSKAGLNMVTRGMAVEWPELIVVAMAPGWTRTELGGPAAPLETADTVRLQQQVFGRLTREDSGRFIDRFGATVPW